MCFGGGDSRRGPSNPAASAQNNEKFRSSSSSESSYPSPDPRKKKSRRREPEQNLDYLLPARLVARPSSSSSSSDRHAAPPMVRRQSTRRRDDGPRQAQTSATPVRRATSKRRSAPPTPAMSEIAAGYALSPARPSKSTHRKTRSGSIISTPSVNPTPMGSPGKGPAPMRRSRQSVQGSREKSSAGSLATASTTPFLKPGGGSSRGGSESGSDTSGAGYGRKTKAERLGTGGLVGLGITTEETLKKPTVKTANPTVLKPVPGKAPVAQPPKAAPQPKAPPAPAPVPTIQVHPSSQPFSATPKIEVIIPDKAPLSSKPKPPSVSNAPASIPPKEEPATPAPVRRPPIARNAPYQTQPKPAPVSPVPISPSALVPVRHDSLSSLASSDCTTTTVSTSSSDSDDSNDSDDSDDSNGTVGANAPEIARRAPSSYAYTPPKAPVRRSPSPESVKGPPPALPAPRPELAPPRKKPDPVTPAPKKRSPPRGSRSSPDTVDYAAFVAESQKKKRERPKISPIKTDFSSYIPPGRRPSSRRTPTTATPTVSTPRTAVKSIPPPLSGRREPGSAARRHALALMKSEDEGSDSDVPTSVAPAAASPIRRLRRQKDPIFQAYDTDASVPEAPLPPPIAPSPPPLGTDNKGGKREFHRAHAPPRGAAEPWFQSFPAGPKEVEQNWEKAGQWEEPGMEHDPAFMPEAPSPPPSRGPGGGEFYGYAGYH